MSTAVAVVLLMIKPAHGQDSANSQLGLPVGIEQLTRLETVPLLRHHVGVHYEGSIDKRGGNADWDWGLYQDSKTQEWVLCEADGPGCLWNFTVHHAVLHSDPVYRFYFDGSETPALEIKHSEFGVKPPFVMPLAGHFGPDPKRDKRLETLDFRIIRSFCPMPFVKALRITSSVQLSGNASRGTGGGWGHAIWHSYPTADGIQTFTGQEDYSSLLALWRRTGEDPKPQAGNVTAGFQQLIPAGASAVVFQKSGEGSIAAVRMTLNPSNRTALAGLWIRITWEGESKPAVECPVGAFFGNEFGFNHVQTLMQGVSPDGMMYNYWPMPFWQSATIEIENRLADPIAIDCAVVFKPASVLAYPKGLAGHFRASEYRPPQARVVNHDAPAAVITGSGHVVAGLVTREKSMCEGDIRVHIDGCGTPAVESDGSESWASYGWGFVYPPQANPASSYDGRWNHTWSMLRLLMGDFYPFRSSFRMTVEGGGGVRHAPQADIQSSIVFWYGEPELAMTLSDFVDVGDAASEEAHGYAAPASARYEISSAFEGEFDNVPITDSGRTLSGPSCFTVTIEPKNRGVLLRRRSDQKERGQAARVYVDEVPVVERSWIAPDGNANFRWLEDEFLIPASYTEGKGKIKLRIEPVAKLDGAFRWNESSYRIYSLGVAAAQAVPEPPLPGNALASFEREASIDSQPWVDGRFGLARCFPVVNGRPCTILTVSSNTPSEFTVEFWMKLKPSSTAQVLIARGPKDAGHWELWVRPETGTLHYFASGLTPQQADSKVKVADDQWHFVSFRVKPGTVALDIDGKTVLDQPVAGQIKESSQPLTLGSLRDGQFPVFGLIEDLRWSSCWRPATAVPTTSLSKDDSTIFLDGPEP